MKLSKRSAAIASTLALLAALSACHKKPPVASAPPPPPSSAPVAAPNAPTISEFAVEPNPIQAGQSATLRWQVKDATDIRIDQEIGAIPLTGRRNVAPRQSTLYTLTAIGPGGNATAAASVSVVSPPPPVQPYPTAAAPSFTDRLKSDVHDAYFDYDKAAIREDAKAVLSQNAVALKQILADFPRSNVVLEGHCDERGSAEYNLGLGDRRAAAAKEFLEQVGVPAGRIVTVSYGKERPQCTELNETCRQKNRRVHFAPGETQKTTN